MQVFVLLLSMAESFMSSSSRHSRASALTNDAAMRASISISHDSSEIYVAQVLFNVVKMSLEVAVIQRMC